MTAPRNPLHEAVLMRLRAELYAAVQLMKGEDLRELDALIAEIAQVRDMTISGPPVSPEESAELIAEATAKLSPPRVCDQVIGFKVAADGESPGDEIECRRPAVALLCRSPICAVCICRISQEDLDVRDILHGLEPFPEEVAT